MLAAVLLPAGLGWSPPAADLVATRSTVAAAAVVVGDDGPDDAGRGLGVVLRQAPGDEAAQEHIYRCRCSTLLVGRLAGWSAGRRCSDKVGVSFIYFIIGLIYLFWRQQREASRKLRTSENLPPLHKFSPLNGRALLSLRHPTARRGAKCLRVGSGWSIVLVSRGSRFTIAARDVTRFIGAKPQNPFSAQKAIDPHGRANSY